MARNYLECSWVHPYLGYIMAPSPVSASIQHPDRYVRTKLRCPGPLVSFQSQDTA